MKPERIEELLQENRTLAASGVRMTHQPIPLDEAQHLLRCARAVAELEEWLRAKEEWRYIQASAVVGEGEMQATLCDGTAVGKADKIVSLEAGPDLLTATEAALRAAKKETT